MASASNKREEAAAGPPDPDALADYASRYHAVVEALAEGVLLIDRKGNVRASNESARRILGLDEATLHGPGPWYDRYQTIHEDGSPFPLREHPTVTTLFTGRPCDRVVLGLRGEGGAVTWLSINTRPLHRAAETDTYAVVASFTDLTESKRAEARLRQSEESHRALFEHSLDGVLLTSDTGQVFDANPAACRMLGHSRAELLRGDRALYVDTSDARLPGALEERSRTGRFSGELALRRADASTFEAELTSVVFTDAQGNRRTSTCFRDATERHRLERMKNEFVSTVSHELRTPLTSIRGVLGLLDGGVLGPLSERAALHVKRACANAVRLARLIDDIVDYAKMGSGKFTLQTAPTAPVSVVAAALEVTGGLSASRGVPLVEGPVCGGGLRGDEGRLCQVLTNLIGNAIKFSPRGASVTVSACEVGLERVRFAVKDHGPGIARADLHKLFQRFQQLDASDSRAQGGTGLGLAISREIVEAHGGEIGVESAPGVGSTFWFELPRG